MPRKTAIRRATPNVLLTGFEPFGGEASNPSWEAVKLLDSVRIAGHRVATRCLPVEFGSSLVRLRAAIREVKPSVVICVGQAGGRAQLSLERIGINIDDARIADNAGAQPVDTPIVADGPAAYFSNLPLKTMLRDLRAAGIPAEVSQTAGTYVCNHVLYGLMHALRRMPRVRGGFVHIPYSPDQAARHPGAPSLSVDVVVQGLQVMLRSALSTNADIRLAAGATH